MKKGIFLSLILILCFINSPRGNGSEIYFYKLRGTNKVSSAMVKTISAITLTVLQDSLKDTNLIDKTNDYFLTDTTLEVTGGEVFVLTGIIDEYRGVVLIEYLIYPYVKGNFRKWPERILLKVQRLSNFENEVRKDVVNELLDVISILNEDGNSDSDKAGYLEVIKEQSTDPLSSRELQMLSKLKVEHLEKVLRLKTVERDKLLKLDQELQVIILGLEQSQLKTMLEKLEIK